MLALSTLALASCHSAAYYYYKFPEYNYAGRPVPPSKLAQRVMIGVSTQRQQRRPADRRRLSQHSQQRRRHDSELFDRRLFVGVSRHHHELPRGDARVRLFQQRWDSDPASIIRPKHLPVRWARSSRDRVRSRSPRHSTRYYGAEEAAGVLEVIDNSTGQGYVLNLPNVFKVIVNKGDTVALAMVRNSNVLYRVFKLNQNQYPTQQAAIPATGSADCEPACCPSTARSPCRGRTTSQPTSTTRWMAPRRMC